MSVLNALTAMETSQVLMRSISTNRCFESALARAGGGDSGLESGHKPQITRGGWCCQGSSHAHKLQFTFLRLRLLRDPPSLQSPADFPSVSSHIPSLHCAPQTRLITFATANITVTQIQEPARGSLSRNRTNYFCHRRGLTSTCWKDSFLSQKTHQNLREAQLSSVMCGIVPCSQEFVVLGMNPLKVCCPSSPRCDIYLPSPWDKKSRDSLTLLHLV